MSETKFKEGVEVMYLDPRYPGMNHFEPVKIRRITRGTKVGDFYEIQYLTGKIRFAITHAIESQLFTKEDAKNYGKDEEGDSE